MAGSASRKTNGKKKLLGIKLEDAAHERLAAAAAAAGKTAHFTARRILLDGLAGEPPFLAFARAVQPQSVLRAAVTASYRRAEEDVVPGLVAHATLPAQDAAAARKTAINLVTKLRAKRSSGIVEKLLQEYALSSQEGVALMCLAEALLRIPDAATRDALIRDKISGGDWQSHVGRNASLFVNAATWGLLLTGKLTATSSETGLNAALTKILARSGEPVVRAGVNIAMRLMGEQFVLGQNIAEALANARKLEGHGFRYSYDMLGEAALTAADAARYFGEYERAIHAIGRAAGGRGIYDGPGISIKLSALHPRYSRAQRARVMAELLPRLIELVALARTYDVGVNIDAEEAERLDLSLDLLEAVCFAPALAGWDGVGFVVQAYQKRAPAVLEFLTDLARRAGRRIAVRLVKGAYWDSEIKRAQADGLEGFPVFTRKVFTDVSYLACARKMLRAPSEIFPQFATHNAQTVASIFTMAGPDADYEFQCLHGMGEALYEEVVGPLNLGRPCRIYAPVGTHETLLAYLVRRLLENGANTSFVNKIANAHIAIDELVADPVAVANAVQPPGTPHPKIAAPAAIFGALRKNSAGLDLSNEQRLGALAHALLAPAPAWQAGPILGGAAPAGAVRDIVNPADFSDIVGTVEETDSVDAAFNFAAAALPVWQATPAAERAATLGRAADFLEAKAGSLIGLIVREAGKTIPAAIGDVREAVDFLRFYARQIADDFNNATHRPLGIVVAISPWNFPLAIFTGQVAAALAAGNVVIAKPAEETPLTAAAAVRLLLEAGVPAGVLQMLPGDGRTGAALVADARVRGVMFTGSTAVAKLIQGQLRLDTRGAPVPLIAETGGQNAMIVDSSALPEQVVTDILASAFDSAGQRCSALRLLIVQEEVADRLLTMLKGAMTELRVGRPDVLETDVGPVISLAAKAAIEAHVAGMAGAAIFSVPAPVGGFFVGPTVIEIPSVDVMGPEIFGPVLHVVRYKRAELDDVIRAVNALGYGLTFGIHSRIEETIRHVSDRIIAGNIYVNRNIIGAVVGSQPFGGSRLSGTGPKAGGPLLLRRLLAERPAATGLPAGRAPAAYAQFLEACAGLGLSLPPLVTPVNADIALPGPVGETNIYRLAPRGRVLCRAGTLAALCAQAAAALATGNVAVLDSPAAPQLQAALPAGGGRSVIAAAPGTVVDAALYDGDAAGLLDCMAEMAALTHALVPVFVAGKDGTYPLETLVTEQCITTNTAAAGGNASLMTIG